MSMMNRTDRIVIGVIIAGGLAYVTCKGVCSWLVRHEERVRRENEELERLVRSCKEQISSIRATADRILERSENQRREGEDNNQEEDEEESSDDDDVSVDFSS